MHNKETGCSLVLLIFLLVLEKVAQMLLQKMQDGKADYESVDAYKRPKLGGKEKFDETREEREFGIMSGRDRRGLQCDMM